VLDGRAESQRCDGCSGCFITEALNPKNHSFGSLIRAAPRGRYSYHHNLYAHNRNRNPRPGNYEQQNPP